MWQSQCAMLGDADVMLDRSAAHIPCYMLSRPLARFKVCGALCCCCRRLQNATLAGGVAMGSSAALRLSPGGAVAVGLFAGTLSTFGFGWLSGVLEQKLNLGDTCGVHVSFC